MCFSSGVYLYFGILMYVKRHEQFEIGCGAISNKLHYNYCYYNSEQVALTCCFHAAHRRCIQMEVPSHHPV